MRFASPTLFDSLTLVLPFALVWHNFASLFAWKSVDDSVRSNILELNIDLYISFDDLITSFIICSAKMRSRNIEELVSADMLLFNFRVIVDGGNVYVIIIRNSKRWTDRRIFFVKDCTIELSLVD